MRAGGLFLSLLAAWTLVGAMAYDQRDMQPQDPRCDVAEVTIPHGRATIVGTSDETASSTLYFHALERHRGVRFDITTDRGAATMWVPYFHTCLNDTRGWYEVFSFCEMEPEMDLVKCDFLVSICKYTCTQDLRSTGPLSFSQTAFGPSRWRSTEPPQGCRVHKILHNPKITVDRCYGHPSHTTRRMPFPTGYPFTVRHNCTDPQLSLFLKLTWC